MKKIMAHESSYIFFRPVDPVKDGAPDYPNIVMHAMSLFTVQDKLDKHQYNSPDEFIADMRQIWTNAKIYNSQTHAIYKAADSLANRFDSLSSTLPQTISPTRRDCSLQIAVELRFARYRSLKHIHG